MRRALYLNCFLLVVLMALVVGCSANLPERPVDGRHLAASDAQAVPSIPEVVRTPSLVLPPAPEAKVELYSVVVQNVPVRELLFAIARDASLNIDVHPEITGNVTLNAIDQTLPQILTRIARQVDIRWNLDRPNLIVEPDKPILRTYRIDYVNIARKSKGEVSVATSISTTGSAAVGDSGGGGGAAGSNNSTTVLSQESNNMFWATLVANLHAILGEDGGAAGGAEAAAGGTSSSIISNPESGLITVRATTRQHEEIQRFIDLVMTRSLQQVLIEATVVEVKLNDRYQAGVDWSSLARDGGRFGFVQSLLGVNMAAPPVTTLTIDKSADPDALTGTIKLLEQFGDLKVLSSPKVMALNNQTAMLKVVDNKVYFTIEVDIEAATDTSPRLITYTSTVHSVPVGFVMAVTPQVSEGEQVTLNVRPTISRIIGYVEDPSPALAEADVISLVPEVQVREVESILKVASGQIGVLGGLMQDTLDKKTDGIPGLSRIPWFGSLFSYRDDTATKTELIIFLRPVVIKQADVNGEGDLRQFRKFLSPQQPIPSLPFAGPTGS
ncbi:MAG: secretin N-terminal domain-containing protein [Proteobacteria bacterium]|nr:secretin N-terminal domain-containing protein [Pseudomonadota bacterium]MBU1648384.1 secretin N-terminal domain-containing protein [Pseudomonadota bacterium]